jgi:hypothetical protein
MSRRTRYRHARCTLGLKQHGELLTKALKILRVGASVPREELSAAALALFGPNTPACTAVSSSGRRGESVNHWRCPSGSSDGVGGQRYEGPLRRERTVRANRFWQADLHPLNASAAPTHVRTHHWILGLIFSVWFSRLMPEWCSVMMTKLAAAARALGTDGGVLTFNLGSGRSTTSLGASASDQPFNGLLMGFPKLTLLSIALRFAKPSRGANPNQFH